MFVVSYTSQVVHVCVYLHVFFPLLVQNSSKVSVKDRLGFSAKPAVPVEKVSLHYAHLLFFSFYEFQIVWKSYAHFLVVPGIFDICGPHKDCIQPSCSEGSPENIREEAGNRRGQIKKSGHILNYHSRVLGSSCFEILLFLLERDISDFHFGFEHDKSGNKLLDYNPESRSLYLIIPHYSFHRKPSDYSRM